MRPQSKVQVREGENNAIVWKDEKKKEVIGKIPANSVVIISDTPKNGMVSIKVPLDTSTLKGWIETRFLSPLKGSVVAVSPTKQRGVVPAPITKPPPSPPPPVATENAAEKKNQTEIIKKESLQIDKTQTQFVGIPVKKEISNLDTDDKKNGSSTEDASRETLHPKLSQDELMIIQKEHPMHLGIQGGGGVAVINDTTNAVYLGPAFTFGGLLSFLLFNPISVRLESDITYAAGTQTGGVGYIYGGINASFNFWDIGANLVWDIWDQFEIFLTLQYAVCIGFGDIPTSFAVFYPSQLSSFWGGVGGGYSIFENTYLEFIVRMRYLISTVQSPAEYQTLGVYGALEFKI